MPETIKLNVADLRVGMYVTKLDRAWLDTPFVMQGFQLEDREDIEIVAEYCEHVWVFSDWEKRASEHSSDVGTATSGAKPALEYQVSAEQEHRQVYSTFRKARTMTKSMLDSIRLGGALDTDQAKHVVSDCVQSVMRNPDALMWMVKIRNEQEYTAEHCLNVCILAIAFGRQLGLSEVDLCHIGLCGLLHDVGKMRVPEHIVNKPGKLTPKEMRMMQAHTVHGRNLLSSGSHIYNGVVDVAYTHHERPDGTGYPRKLSDTGISQFAKIVAIVDAYDAMTAHRCYSPAKTSTDALKVIFKEKGKQFDERFALKFIETVGLYPPGSIVELLSGEVGIVIESNQRYRHLPRVILILDKNKKTRAKEKIVDLSHIETADLPRGYLIKKVLHDGSYAISVDEYRERGLTFKI